MSTPSSAPVLALRLALLGVVALALLGGIAGGLARLGVDLSGGAGADWLGRAALHHATLMIGGFLGTVIGIERAVALKLRIALLAPLASALAALCLLTGAVRAGTWLLLLAAVAFVAINLLLVRRQRAAHTLLLLVAALAWLVGNLQLLGGQGGAAQLSWWFAFLVLTIVAERLEMTRLMPRHPAMHRALLAAIASLLLGAAVTAVSPPLGAVLFGVALAGLAAWLWRFDIARRTVHSHGLSRYMALCLLGGYLWLGIAGLAWAGSALGWPLRDLALHALGLGFVLSMVMGHAPVILPAVARVKLAFGAGFYVPLLALHASLLLRFGPGAVDAGLRAAGGVLNALAVALFAVTVIVAALRWRYMHDVAGGVLR